MSNGQSPEEMQRLQQEAVRRVQEMQSRARSAAERSRQAEAPGRHQQRPEAMVGSGRGGPPPKEVPPPFSEEPKCSTEQEGPKVSISNPKHQGGMTDIFEALLSDSERTLILLLILLLVGEETDMGLVLALMYLII